MLSQIAPHITPQISTTQPPVSKLEELFATFNQVSLDLGVRYKQLEARVAELSAELAVTHSARLNELTAKEQLAAKLGTLMDTLPGGILVLDANGAVLEANPVAQRMLGVSAIRHKWTELLQEVSTGVGISGGEITLRSGMRVCISSNAFGDKGEQVVLLTDVSENFRLRNLINREERLAALGEMSARLAHQVRTPLSTAILYLSHLATATSGEQSNSIVKKIHSRLRQIESLTESMLSYIRGETRAHQIFSLNAMLKEVKDATALQLKQRGGELRLGTPINDCLLEGDKEALFNAVSNLVENSLQATTTAPIISISLWRDATHYCVIVEDNGPGIDVELREKIFDPFFSGRTGGTGLGLAVVQSAVKACGGTISINTAKTGGALIEIKLPVSHQPQGSNTTIFTTNNSTSTAPTLNGEIAHG